VPNRFPIAIDGIAPPSEAGVQAGRPRPAHGVHDVVIESPAHVRSILDNLRFNSKWKNAAPQAKQDYATARYMNLPGEREARAVEERMGLSPEARRMFRPEY
jgi:hypothetical protein